MRPHWLPPPAGSFGFFTVRGKEIFSDVHKKTGIIPYRIRTTFRLHEQERTDRRRCIRFHASGHERQESEAG
jgi:hypothetical protein